MYGAGERRASGLYGGGRVKPLTRLAGYATLSPSSSTMTTRGGPAPFDPLGPLEPLLWRGTSCPSGSVKSLSMGPWSSSHSLSTLVASSGCEGSGGGMRSSVKSLSLRLYGVLDLVSCWVLRLLLRLRGRWGEPLLWRETCPVSTEGGTRRVQLVRKGGGGGGGGSSRGVVDSRHATGLSGHVFSKAAGGRTRRACGRGKGEGGGGGYKARRQGGCKA